MQPLERIAGERQPMRINEPGDIEHAQTFAHQIRKLREPLIQRFELGAEFLRRGARPLVGEAFFRRALPELDLDVLVAILRALHRAGAILGIALERLGRLRRAGRREHESESSTCADRDADRPRA